MKNTRAVAGHLFENLLIVAASVIAAIFLAKAGIFETILTQTKELELIGSFIAGLFFTSLFTVAPATVALGEIAQANNIFLVAVLGGAGAVIGDLVLFKFLKSHLTDELVSLFSHPKRKRAVKVFNLKVFHWLMIFLGAVVIASPLPDEIGLMLMGISKLRPSILMPISFVLNSIGILIVGLVARQIG